MGMPYGMPPEPPPLPPKARSTTIPKVSFPSPTPEAVFVEMPGQTSSDASDEHRRTWMPKMDFPKFHGTDARIWVDTCNTFFQLYNIAEGFKVSAATMYMRDNAAHWYQSYKLIQPYHSWPVFAAAVIQEFEGNMQRDKTRELLTSKQIGTVEEYKRQFDMLVYQIHLYDPHISGMMLVQQFILGLKEELRAAVEVQMPDTLAAAAAFAAVQGVMDGMRFWSTKSYTKRPVTKGDTSGSVDTGPHKFEKGELWKAKHLKDYRRANGLCFKCGEKFAPGHQCPTAGGAQLKALETSEILSDEVLDALVTTHQDVGDDCHVSLHALSGATDSGTIQLRALDGNQVLLLLVDSGSSHCFIDTALVQKLQLLPEVLAPTRMKVANGDSLLCTSQVKGLTWWLQGHTFSHDMRVLQLGGYNGILGMDWLKQWGTIPATGSTGGLSLFTIAGWSGSRVSIHLL